MVDSSKAIDPLEKIRRHIRILVDIGRLAGERLDLERFLDQAVVQIARAVEIHHVKILQYRPPTADLFMIAGVGWKEGSVRTATLSTDLRSPPGRAFQTAEAVNIHDFAQQQEFVRSDFLKEHGIVSVSNVPVLIDSAAWGVLEVDSKTPRDFSEDTTDFLTAAAALIGTAIRQVARLDEEARFRAAAEEAQRRDILLREMQHRVKNNFQLILSSISMEKRKHTSQDSLEALNHIAQRISAISLAHDQLAPRQEGQIVKLGDYVRALCNSIRQQVEGIDVIAECDELELPLDRALPLGLILNETAMNSIKHAFGTDGGTIRVKLVGGIGFNEARLSISDNGRGIQTPNENGLGLKLITSLARQIGGSIVQESFKGTVVTLTFPLMTS